MEQSYLWTAIVAALKAGEGILTIYNNPESDFQVEHKKDDSPLTIADKLSNDIITDFLSKTPFPILSEEGKSVAYSVRKQWEKLWIVDPLDGTKEFIKRNGEFTVNIALVDNQIPILGVIYLPVKNELYFASKEIGAYKCVNITADNSFEDVTSLIKGSSKLPTNTDHDVYTIVASRSHLSPETELYIDALKQTHNAISMISSGSSIKICLVAEGSADEYPRFAPTMEWDTAAGNAIVLAAGKVMTEKDGITPLRYNKEDLLNPWFIVKDKVTTV